MIIIFQSGADAEAVRGHLEWHEMDDAHIHVASVTHDALHWARQSTDRTNIFITGMVIHEGGQFGGLTGGLELAQAMKKLLPGAIVLLYAFRPVKSQVVNGYIPKDMIDASRLLELVEEYRWECPESAEVILERFPWLMLENH